MQPQPDKQPEKQMQTQPQEARSKARPKTAGAALSASQKNKFWLGILAAAGIALGGWALLPPVSPDADYLTNDDKAKIASDFEQISSLPVKRITDPEEAKQAIASMQLEPEKQAELEAKVNNGDLDMAWVQAWDNHAEDGDALRFESETYQVTTTIMNKPVYFALPLTKGMNYVKVTGVHDGGGGITASVITASGATSVPVVEVGMSYTLPLK